MKLRLLNKELIRYGFSDTLEYKPDDGEFNGHLKGVVICVCNIKYNRPLKENKPFTLDDIVIYDNYLPDVPKRNKTQDLLEILNNDNIMKSYQKVINDNEASSNNFKTLVYISYYVDNHTCFAPTINFKNVSPETSYKVDVELLFVHDGLNRYGTMRFVLKNTSIWQALELVFTRQHFLKEMGCFFDDSSDQSGLSLDFYDDVGEQVTLHFDSIKSLQGALVSTRLIAIGLDER